MEKPLKNDEGRCWDIIGVGDIDVDMFLGVSQLAGRDGKVVGKLLGEYPGGMTANVICVASRLGAKTAMIGRVGTDTYADIALSGLRDFGVDTSLVRVIQDGKTFYCVIMLDSSGEKALTAVDTDCRLPQREDIDPETLAKTRVVHVMGDNLETACWVAEEAKKRNALVSLDLEASTAVHGLHALKRLLKNTDILFMNGEGCQIAFGDDSLASARRALTLGPRIVAITRGAKGAIIVDHTSSFQVDALHEPVVDTTGAGDCFIGAFLAHYIDGHDLWSISRYAAAAASYAIGSVGSRTSLPTHEMVLNRIARTTSRTLQEGES